MQIAWSIVHDLRALNPPARFVQKDTSTGLWHDVGDKKFREKVSQALREHQPSIKAVLGTVSGKREEYDSKLNVKQVDMQSSCSLGRLFEESESSPSTCVLEKEPPSKDLRKAFALGRNEDALTQNNLSGVEEHLFGTCSGVSGPSLSEIMVSQGPSFVIPGSARNSVSWSDLVHAVTNTSKNNGSEGLFSRFSGDLNSFMSGQSNTDWTGRNADRINGQYEALKDNIHDLEGERLVPSLSNSTPCVCRPDIAKRATSNQNESVETKKGYYDEGTVKRCTLSRDKSEVARKLKQSSQTDPPDVSDIDSDFDTMIALSAALENSFSQCEKDDIF